MNFDPVTDDPAPDKEYPSALAPVTFKSGGEQLLGVLLQAQERGPHPAIILLHGFPGNERNFDLAHVFRRAGWHVLVFHYRGAWGSSGAFSFTHVLQDVESAITFLRSSALQYRIISEKIVLIGHSMGGFAALMTAALNPTVYAAASLAGVNIGYFAQIIGRDAAAKKAAAQFFTKGLPPLQGASAEDLLDEIRAHAESWNLLHYAKVLSTCPILLIGGSRDKTAPVSVHFWPLVKALENNTHCILDADHSFSDKRITLARTVLSWLSQI
jgi:pimeloyl-ACP methyl ester carboxylesterase